jgi:hypothetical protein
MFDIHIAKERSNISDKTQSFQCYDLLTSCEV